MEARDVDQTKLAIDGGTPVRTAPLPWELPGAHWIGEEELELVTRVIRAKSPFRFYGIDPQGMADQLEAEFREYFQVPFALAINSATAGLQIALSALEIGAGSEVLLPGYLWTSCIASIVRLGAIPKLVDIDNTFTIDPDDLRKKIGPHTKAVLYVHMSGAPGRIDEVAEICQENKLALVEDCAQSIGASLHGKNVGTFGDVAVFSFQANKNITSGDGGMLLCRNEHIYNRLFAIHDIGYARAKGRLDISDDRYQLWGIGGRMSELTAACLLGQFRKLDRITGAMRSAKWSIRSALQDIGGLQFRNILDPKGDSGPFLITRYPNADICQRFTTALVAEGIQGHMGSLVCFTMQDFGLHWYFNNLSLVNRRSLTPDGFPWTHPSNAFSADYNYQKGQLPFCDEMHARASQLTIASVLTPTDIDEIIRAFRKVAAVLLNSSFSSLTAYPSKS